MSAERRGVDLDAHEQAPGRQLVPAVDFFFVLMGTSREVRELLLEADGAVDIGFAEELGEEYN